MDLDRMLQRCRRTPWSVDDIDWSGTPRAMAADEELLIVQFFTDLTTVERVAADMFEYQRRHTNDPRLQEIFTTFIADELRHAEVMRRLARYYDVHHYREYQISPELEHFRTCFLDALTYVTNEVATAFIVAGELLLDVVLLRSLDDYVRDDTSRSAMDRVKRDEARHIAIDYYMTELFVSPESRQRAAQRERRPLSHQWRGLKAFITLMASTGPVVGSMFLRPMATMDPTGRHMRDGAKLIQLLRRRRQIVDLPFNRYLRTLDVMNNHPLLGPIFGRVARRFSGDFPIELAKQLFTDDELARADAMPLDEMAQEALRVTRRPRAASDIAASA